MTKYRFSAVWCSTAIACGLIVSPARAAIIENFSIVSGGNYSAASQVWGGALAVGNVSGSATIGTELDPPASFVNAVTLGVGAAISGGPFNLQAGSVFLSGTQGGVSINFNGGGQTVENDPTILQMANDGVAELTAASSTYSSVAANSVVDQDGNSFTFVPTFSPSGVATFTVNASAFEIPNALYSLDTSGAVGGESYIVNVIGNIGSGVIAGGGSNFPAGFMDVSDFIIWNFADQTTDLVVQTEWQGSILLPNASLTNNSPVNGGVYVGGDFTQQADVRSTGFQGTLVPEPSSLATVGLLGLALAGLRWRYRSERGEIAGSL